MDGERIWQYASLPEAEAANTVSLTFFRPSDTALPNRSAPLASPVLTTLSRPTFGRASTSTTLFNADTDFVSADSVQKPSVNSRESANLVDCSRGPLLSGSVAPVDDGNGRRALIAPSAHFRRRHGRKRTSKNMMARWIPDPLERGIRVNRPVTGLERFACLQRLSAAV